MTHTLHRRGGAEELSNDFVVFAMAAQSFNDKGAAKKFDKFSEVLLKYNPVSFGDMKTGNVFSTPKDEILNSFQDNSIVHAVYTDEDTVTKVLAELKELDLGLSVVVSGLSNSIDECCQKVGLKSHSVNKSLGIWGNRDRLPADEVLDASTMCGHGMVAFSLVEDLAEQVKKGMDAEKAAEEMAKLCHCGVFNTARGANILKKLAEKI